MIVSRDDQVYDGNIFLHKLKKEEPILIFTSERLRYSGILYSVLILTQLTFSQLFHSFVV